MFKRAAAVFGIILGFVIPTATAVSAYYKASEKFAPKEDLKEMRTKVDRIAEDVAEIKGMMKSRRQ